MKHNFSILKNSLWKSNSKNMQHIIVAVLLFYCTSIYAQNLVVNPGFETGTGTPWVLWQTAYFSTVTPYAGTKCGKTINLATVEQVVSGLTANTNYIVSSMFRATTGTMAVGIKKFRTTDGSDEIKAQTTSTDWIATGNIAFRTGATNTSVIVFLYTPLGSTGSADDFSLTVSPADAEAPTAPTSLIATDILRNSFTLSWSAATDNVAVSAYDVYKDGVLFATTSGGVRTSMSIAGLTQETTYTMTVIARDAAGNSSPLSASYDVPTSPVNANLVENASFENANSLPWILTNGTVSVSNYYEGLKCVWIGLTSSLTQTIYNLQPSTKYVLTAQYKAASATSKIGVRNYLTSTTGDAFVTLPVNTSWTPTGNIVFTTGVGMTSAQLYASVPTSPSNGSTYIDAFSVVAVDVTSPTVMITSSTSSTTNSNPIPVTITFNETVTGFTLADLSVTNGTASNFVAVSGTVYTADIIPLTVGAVTVDIASAISTDVAGNANVAANQFTRSYTDVPTALSITGIMSHVYSSNSKIVIEGLAGQIAVIYSIAGQSVKSILLTSSHESVVGNKGFYIVKIGDENYKLLLK